MARKKASPTDPIQVCILHLSEMHDSYSDYAVLLRATDWETVTREEADLLNAYALRTREFIVIRKPIDQKEVIENTVHAQLEWVKNEEARKEAEREERDRKARARKAKLEQKKLDEKRKLLMDLKKELGEA